MTKWFIWLLPIAGLLACASTRGDGAVLDTVTLGPDEIELAAAFTRARSAVRRARENRDDLVTQRNAALAMFEFTDLRLQLAAERRAARQSPDTGAARLALEHEIDPDDRDWVRRVSAEGLQFANRARLLAPRDPGSAHAVALHSGLRLQTLPPLAALTRVRDVTAKMEATIAIDPSWSEAAPLVLYGRFRDRAPWPHQDRERAIQLLERAVALAPTPRALLFLGDARFGIGDRFELAIETWKAAEAAARRGPELSDELIARRARARLRLEQRWTQPREVSAAREP